MSLDFIPLKQVEDFNDVLTTANMPNVFVVPPEEDQTPPWCFFDAENPSLSQVVGRPETPEIAVLLPYHDDTSIYRRNPHSTNSVVPALKDLETISVVQALFHDEADDEGVYDSEFEENMGLDPQATQESYRHEFVRTPRDVADDSDVIEVVKLSRRDYSSEDPEEIRSIQTVSEHKRTTLKYRASKVFRSLRGTLRSSKTRAQDAFKSPPSSISSSHSAERSLEDTYSRPRTPTVSRRRSLVLSQLFATPSPSLKPRNSKNSFEEPISPPMEAPPPPSRISQRSFLYAATAQDDARLQAASPTPTTTSTKSGTRRFSIMNLQRLFSFPPSVPQADASAPFDAGRATPTLRSNPSSSPSTASSVTTSGPQTPTSSVGMSSAHILSTDDVSDFPVFMGFDSPFDANAGLNLGLGLGLDLDSGSSSIHSRATPRKNFPSSSSWRSLTPKASNKAMTTSCIPHDEDGDTSLEMRLDSFHFDSLSFDADQFQAK